MRYPMPVRIAKTQNNLGRKLSGGDASNLTVNVGGNTDLKGGAITSTQDANDNPISLDEFLETPEGQKMSGPTGGVQGYKGTLFGEPYKAGSWQDKLIESFAGTHDMIGAKLSGLYYG